MTADKQLKTETPKEALLGILQAAKDECDDYVERFLEADDEDLPEGDPFKLGKTEFAEWVEIKGICDEDAHAWAEAVSRAWDLVTAVKLVADPDVEKLHDELRGSVIRLENLLDRCNVECGILECGR